MPHTESHSRARKSFWHMLAHLLGLVMLAVIIATIVAIVHIPSAAPTPMPTADRPARIFRPGYGQQLQDQPIMIKGPGSGPLVYLNGEYIPLPPLPGVPRDSAIIAQTVQIGQKTNQFETFNVYEVIFDNSTKQEISAENIYLMPIKPTAGPANTTVPECDLNEILVDEYGIEKTDAAAYGYEYADANGAAEAALLAVDANNDNIPDNTFATIFFNTFFKTDDVPLESLADFDAYNVTFEDTATLTSGPDRLFAIVTDSGTFIDPTACRPRCGNGDIESPEACDPDTGTTSSDGIAESVSSTCNDDCSSVDCGDTIVNEEANEECDDGNEDSHDTCTNECTDAICGDGYVQSGEDCDDGNENDDDGCTACAEDIGYYCVNSDADLDIEDWPESVCDTDCGDAIVGGFEFCDQGSSLNGTPGSCCTDECNIRAADEQCRAASGVCDIAEYCDGLDEDCPADEVEDVSTSCRAAAGVCDTAEYCDGSAKSCPANAFVSNDVSCRDSTDGGVCDTTEYCDGSAATCPAENYALNGNSCADDSNECTQNICDDNLCTHPNEVDGTDCAEVNGNECTEWYCFGGSCAQVDVSNGALCGDMAVDYCYLPSVECEPETDGYSQCMVCGNGILEEGNEACDDGDTSPGDGCNASCQVESGWSCDGDCGEVSICAQNCPVGNACSASSNDGNACTVDVCNASNVCVAGGSGTGWTAYASSGSACSADTELCTDDICNGAGTCATEDVDDGTPCLNLANGDPIDNGHCYGGVCDNYCGDGVTDDWEDCDEGDDNGTLTSCCSATCSYLEADEECRAADGVCDVAEVCTGSSADCPADAFDSETQCRAASGECDPADICDGTQVDCPDNEDGWAAVEDDACDDGDADDCHFGTCTDGLCDNTLNFDVNGTQCGDSDWCYDGTCYECGNGGAPDPGEECDEGGGNGSDTSCCDSVCLFRSVSSVCRDSAGFCDVADYCTGAAGACPTDEFESDDTVCRASAGECDEIEYCSGSGATCPSQSYSVINGTTCTDDANPCTDNTCSNGSCTANNNASACNDGDGNTCTSGTCTGGACSASNLVDGASCPSGICQQNASACPGEGFCCFPVF